MGIDQNRAASIKVEELTVLLKAARESDDQNKIALAVRASLAYLSKVAPGRSVELRVPPFAAVQLIEGANHRRGTPPNIVEIKASVWLELATGSLTAVDAIESGDLYLSGERAKEIINYLPIVKV